MEVGLTVHGLRVGLAVRRVEAERSTVPTDRCERLDSPQWGQLAHLSHVHARLEHLCG